MEDGEINIALKPGALGFDNSIVLPFFCAFLVVMNIFLYVMKAEFFVLMGFVMVNLVLWLKYFQSDKSVGRKYKHVRKLAESNSATGFKINKTGVDVNIAYVGQPNAQDAMDKNNMSVLHLTWNEIRSVALQKTFRSGGEIWGNSLDIEVDDPRPGMDQETKIFVPRAVLKGREKEIMELVKKYCNGAVAVNDALK